MKVILAAETQIKSPDFSITDRHLLAVLEGASLGVWLHEPATGRVLWSDFLCRLLKYAKAEAPTTLAAWIDLVHPADRQAVQAALTTGAAADSGLPALEFRIRDQNGAWSAVCLRHSPMTSGSDEVCWSFDRSANVSGTHKKGWH